MQRYELKPEMSIDEFIKDIAKRCSTPDLGLRVINQTDSALIQMEDRFGEDALDAIQIGPMGPFDDAEFGVYMELKVPNSDEHGGAFIFIFDEPRIKVVRALHVPKDIFLGCEKKPDIVN